MWRASVLTIFPEMFPGPLGTSLAGKALAAGQWSLETVDIRKFATDKDKERALAELVALWNSLAGKPPLADLKPVAKFS